jgi:leukotriene-A4 hydrolase
MGELEGEASFQFRAARGRDRLAEAVKQWGPAHPYTRLVPDLSAGVDPDDAFSGIPYEKGFYLIYHLETLVGGPAAFLPFFRAYVAEFAARPLTADDFRAFFTAYFASRGVPAASAVDWDTWLHGLGMPPDVNTYDESMAEAAYALARRWHATDVLGIGGSPPQPQGASPSDLKNWSSAQLVTFLDRLGELRSLAAAHPSTTRAMARLYGLDASRNAEVRCAWYLLCIKARDPAVLPLAEAFLGEQGRMKFVRPLYRALRGWEGQGREVATRAFERNKNKYHPVARKMCAVDLGIVPGDSGGA